MRLIETLKHRFTFKGTEQNISLKEAVHPKMKMSSLSTHPMAMKKVNSSFVVDKYFLLWSYNEYFSLKKECENNFFKSFWDLGAHTVHSKEQYRAISWFFFSPIYFSCCFSVKLHKYFVFDFDWHGGEQIMTEFSFWCELFL